MIKHLLDDALRRVWCMPYSKSNYTVKLFRYSNSLGYINTVTYNRSNYTLPKSLVRFNIFHMTDFITSELHLNITEDEWFNLDSLFFESNVTVHLFSSKGLTVPNDKVWVLKKDNTILFAIERFNSLEFIVRDDIYYHVYDSGYYVDDDGADYTNVSKTVLSISDIVVMQNTLNVIPNRESIVKTFNGGYLTPGISPITVAVGDHISYEITPAVDSVIEKRIDDLTTFNSVLDTGVQKFLIHNPNNPLDVIPLKDIEIYFISVEGIGVRYVVSEQQQLRMVTNRDYSIPTSEVDRYIAMHPDLFTNQDDMSIRVYIKKSPDWRVLSNSTLKLVELNELDEVDYLNVVAGMDSNISVWHAANLENSAHVKLINSRYSEIDDDSLVDVYGYDALVKQFYTPVVPATIDGETWTINKAVGFDEHSVYKHTAGGIITSPIVSKTVTSYNVGVSEGDIYEYFNSIAVTNANYQVYSNVDVVPLEEGVNYRVYIKEKNLTEETNWVDVTKDTTKCIFDYDNLQLDIYVDLSSYDVLVFNDNAYRYGNYTFPDLDTLVYRGVITFTIPGSVKDQNDNWINVSDIPPGRVDVFINNHYLVEGIDYVMDYPNVKILTKEYLNSSDDEPVKILFRCLGFCDENLEMEKPYDSGYVKHGYLSDDGVFELHKGKALSVFIGGKLVDQSSVNFKEYGKVALSNNLEGLPYVTLEPIMSFNRELNSVSYDLRDRNNESQKQISDYLTGVHEDPNFGEVINIGDYQSLYSTLMSRLVYIYENTESPNTLSGSLTDAKVRSIVNDNRDVYNIDPCVTQKDNPYVKVQPLPTYGPRPLNVHIFNLLSKVNKMYLNNKVALNSYFTISYN